MLGQGAGLNFEMKRPQQGRQQEQRAPEFDSGMPDAATGLLAGSGLTSEYYTGYGQLETFAKMMWEKHEIDVTKPDPTNQVAMKASELYQQGVAYLNTSANQLKRDAKYEAASFQNRLTNPDAVDFNVPGSDTYDINRAGNTAMTATETQIAKQLGGETSDEDLQIENQGILDTKRKEIEKQLETETNPVKRAKLEEALKRFPKSDYNSLQDDRIAAANYRAAIKRKQEEDKIPDRYKLSSIYSSIAGRRGVDGEEDIPIDISLIKNDPNVYDARVIDTANRQGIEVVLKKGEPAKFIDFNSTDKGFMQFKALARKIGNIWDINKDGFREEDEVSGIDYDPRKMNEFTSRNVTTGQSNKNKLELEEDVFKKAIRGEAIAQKEGGGASWTNKDGKSDRIISEDERLKLNEKNTKAVEDELNRAAATGNLRINGSMLGTPGNSDYVELGNDNYEVKEIRTDGQSATIVLIVEGTPSEGKKTQTYTYDLKDKGGAEDQAFDRFLDDNVEFYNSNVIGHDAFDSNAVPGVKYSLNKKSMDILKKHNIDLGDYTDEPIVA